MEMPELRRVHMHALANTGVHPLYGDTGVLYLVDGSRDLLPY